MHEIVIHEVDFCLRSFFVLFRNIFHLRMILWPKRTVTTKLLIGPLSIAGGLFMWHCMVFSGLFSQSIGLVHIFMVPFLAVINPNSFGLVHLWKIRYVDYVENILIFLVWNVFVFQRPFQDQWECWNFVKILFSLQSPILQLLSSNFFSSI